ncbi:substrate-binding periplasmic protein [Thalassomonas actiniarum]|uniref:Transporter substrate-binding domain-containing protein n=1 Tax=Thalassomonas actiniarum TaxID=485447 RepID=A0AAF0C1F8_9GAMM|nr:transporter substrate-binding domain-containing protein [Thalassomonas actiniarum]WDD96908.1 transporter substrate-binding domain-containing protein [Thalassomonas actiniarum]
MRALWEVIMSGLIKMMKTLSLIQVRIGIIFFTCLSAAVSAENRTAVIVVEHWPPWEIARDTKKEQVTEGLAVELIRILADRLDISIELKNAPWGRAQHMIKTGQADVIPMIIKNAEREADMLFTVPVYKDRLLFAYSTDKFETFEWQRWEDLRPYKVGITRGYNYVSEITVKEDVYFEMVTTDKMNILKLLHGRVDVIPLYYVSAIAMFKEIPGHEKLRFAEKPLATKVFRLGISKKSFLAEKIDEINKTLQEMQNDGTFKKILGEYYLE